MDPTEQLYRPKALLTEKLAQSRQAIQIVVKQIDRRTRHQRYLTPLGLGVQLVVR
jgi:hypothetical protein